MRNAWIAAFLVTSLGCTEPPSQRTQPATADPTQASPHVAARGAPLQARSFRFTAPTRRHEIAASEAPMSLTASDGTGLSLVSLRAEAVVEGPLAFTQLHLAFENPESRVIEGQFRITLPTGATVSRFAMKIDERWQEGEVVELQAARRAYEDFLHRRQDPALLEQAAGNEFSARVFPIPARGRKELILSYSQELVSAEQPYRIPLRGLPKLGELSIRVFADGAIAAADDRRGIVPVEDFVAPALRSSAGVRSGDLAVVRVTPPVEAAPDEIDSLLILVDTSASRALGFEEQARTVESLVGALASGAGDVPVLVAAFDQEVETIHQGGARGFDASATARLVARTPLGASDLGAALAWAAKARHDGAPYRRVVLVSDGVATAGDLEAEPLRASVASLGAAGVERLDALVVGGIRDEDRLAQLVTAGLARDGAVIDGSAGAETIAHKLTSRSKSGIAVAVEGAEWSWPRRLDAVQAGDQALIYARIAAGSPLRVSLDGKPVELARDAIAQVQRPLVERAVARAEIASLIAARDAVAATDKSRRAEIKNEIISISTAKRVLSPFTALLVLETEDDYARFGIDRRALADVLAVGDGGLTLLRRSEATLVIAAPARPKKRTGTKDGALEKAKEDPAAAEDAEAGADQPGPNKQASEPGEPEKVDLAVDDAVQGELDEAKRAEGPSDVSGGGHGSASAGSAPSASAPATASPAPAPEPAPARSTPARPLEEAMPDHAVERRPSAEPEIRERVNPYTGTFRDVMRLVRGKKLDQAVDKAATWRAESPGDVMALVALGEALEAKGDVHRAARAYGSLIDLFPQRADLRRFAGQRLERMKDEGALALAADTYAKAADQRVDHPASHRLLGFALLRQGKHEQAFAAIERGLGQSYPDNRFAGVREILAEDLGLVAAAWIRVAPEKRAEIRARLKKAGGKVEDGPSIRFVLNWETDANDVDFHIHDGAGNHAFFSQPTLASGGHLYADVTTGYGPECFTIRGARKQRAFPYRLEAHYYSRGPMGYGMGKLEIIDHDGAGNLRFEERPFVIMQDNAFVDLGIVRR